MFPTLAAAIREVEIPADAAALRQAVALHDRLGAKVAAAVGEFDGLRLWDLDCAPSMKSWLVDEGVAPQDAHRLVANGKRLRELPVLAAMWQAGDLSNGQVRAITENLVDRHVGLFGDAQHTLLPSLVGLSVKDTNAVMVEWRACADAAVDDTPPGEAERSLQFSNTFEGRYAVNGGFDVVGGDMIATALAVADSNDLTLPANRRRADALVAISQFFLDHNTDTISPRQRPHVSLIIDADSLDGYARGEGFAINADTGGHYDPATVSRYLCDCAVSRTVAEKIAKGMSRILDLGRAQRTASPAQRNALAARDRGCRWRGCHSPMAWCEAHHIVPWEHGGPTDMDNLVLLCGRHHDLVHRKHIRLKLLPDATLEAALPDGTTWTTRPPGTGPPPQLEL